MSEQPVRLADIARVFLKIGAMSYGGPAIMGIMQAEVQEKRQWLSKQQFVEGLTLVNMLPGPGATSAKATPGSASRSLRDDLCWTSLADIRGMTRFEGGPT